jgi:hypothetical protein
VQPAALDLPKCRGFQAIATDVLAKTLRPSDTLFLPSLRLARFKDQWGVVDDAPRAGDQRTLRDLAEREAAAATQRLAATGARLVFEAPEPIFKSPTFRCADWFNAGNPICAEGLTMDRAELETRRGPVLQAIRRLMAADPRIEVWDPFPILCPGTRCSALDGDAPLFFDADHLSGHGNDVLEPAFTRSMNAGSLTP